MSMLTRLASLKLSLAGMVALIVGVLISYFNPSQPVLWIALPLLLLSLNLVAAIIMNPRIRQNSGLLMFHICLVSLAVLAALGQLNSMTARLELSEDQAFDTAQLGVIKQGPLHSLEALESLILQQRRVEVAFAPGMRRGATQSQLLFNDTESIVMGDNLPFRYRDYRFYTSSNKGFAVVLALSGVDGQVQQGAIHFPSFPLYDWKQKNQWTTPAGEVIQLELVLAQVPDYSQDWLLDSANIKASLALQRASGEKIVLQTGDTMLVDGMVLKFVAVRMWMGYNIFYNPYLNWLFAVSIVGVLGLGWHFYIKLFSSVKTTSVPCNPAAGLLPQHYHVNTSNQS